MNTLRAEVDEYRAVSYDMIMTAINASYNPGSTNNPLLVTNVAETLASLEFFSRQWLGESGVAATFLTMEDKLSSYQAPFLRVTESIIPHVYHDIPGAMVTNWATGRPYGYLDAASGKIIVSDRYAFLRCNFPFQNSDYSPNSSYEVIVNRLSFPVVVSTNFRSSLETTERTITNYFGHVYASPVNISWYPLSLDDKDTWWNNGTDSVVYREADQPDCKGTYYEFRNPPKASGIADFYYLYVLARYNQGKGSQLPRSLGVEPRVFAFGYPIAISNCIGRTVNAVAFVNVDDANVTVIRYDLRKSEYTDQYYSIGDCYGFARFEGKNSGQFRFIGVGAYRQKYSSGNGHFDQFVQIYNHIAGNAYYTVPAATTKITLYIGGQMSFCQDCFQGNWGSDFFCDMAASISFKTKEVKVVFY